jgi:hypothetical protein
MMGWLAAGGWASAALAAAVMGWLWEREKRKRERADARAAAYEDRNIRMAGQLATMAGTAKQQIDRLERANDVLREHLDAALASMEAIATDHPGLARDLLGRVFQDAAAASSRGAELAPVSEDAAAGVPGRGKPTN